MSPRGPARPTYGKVLSRLTAVVGLLALLLAGLGPIGPRHGVPSGELSLSAAGTDRAAHGCPSPSDAVPHAHCSGGVLHLCCLLPPLSPSPIFGARPVSSPSVSPAVAEHVVRPVPRPPALFLAA